MMSKQKGPVQSQVALGTFRAMEKRVHSGAEFCKELGIACKIKQGEHLAMAGKHN